MARALVWPSLDRGGDVLLITISVKVTRVFRVMVGAVQASWQVFATVGQYPAEMGKTCTVSSNVALLLRCQCIVNALCGAIISCPS